MLVSFVLVSLLSPSNLSWGSTEKGWRQLAAWGQLRGEGGPCFHPEGVDQLTKLVPAWFSAAVSMWLAWKAKSVPNRIEFLFSSHKETQRDQ
jgi:hypothetical protein